MAKNLSDILAALAVERQLDLNRVLGHETNLVFTVLEDLLRDVEGRIGARPLTEYQKARLNRLLEDIREVVAERYGDLQTTLFDDLKDLAKQESQWVLSSVNNAVGVDVMRTLAPSATLRALVDTGLFQGAPLGDWLARQSADTAFRFANEIRTGVAAGETNGQIVSRIGGSTRRGLTGVVETSRRNAEALVRTATQTVSAKARDLTWNANQDIVKGKQQISTLDSRTSDICIAYAGASWDLKNKPINGNKLPYNGGVPRHWNCRSTEIPLLKSFRELGMDVEDFTPTTRASMDGQVAADLSFADFLSGKSKAFQDEVLGKGKADLWRSGKITLQQLLDQRGNPLTLAQLQERANAAAPPDLRDNVSKKYFNGKVDVEFHPSVPGDARENLSPATVARLTGAPDGSNVHVGQSDAGMTFTVKHPMLDEMVRQIREDEDGKVLIVNESFLLKRRFQSQGIGVRSLAIEATEAAKQGFTKIVTEAAGRPGSNLFNGYYTWPRLGYDGPLTDNERARLPQGLADARSVLDLMESEAGRAWWLQNGSGKVMEFDLQSGSRSWDILTRYLKENGVQI
ncbi:MULTISPECIES: phage minor head protein [unclassified Cupriavidus]|uniref:phage minor head protein n=1 Tax=unclassified Cupriavidus TaxID=2640874 RepID=UPI00313E5F78